MKNGKCHKLVVVVAILGKLHVSDEVSKTSKDNVKMKPAELADAVTWSGTDVKKLD